MGPSLRLLPTTAATTLRKIQEPPLVIDGPFAETKEQLLGFYVIDVADLDAALDVARELAAVNPGGAYEVRPIALYKPDRTSHADERPRMDRSGAYRCASPGHGGAAALFPRPRQGRGGLSGSGAARLAKLAAQRSAARSGRVAHPGRAQRRLG